MGANTLVVKKKHERIQWQEKQSEWENTEVWKVKGKGDGSPEGQS